MTSNRKNQALWSTALFAASLFAATSFAATAARADTWRGTAPFCDGKCEKGESEVKRDKYGDGSKCLSGHKVLCHNLEPTCIPREVTTECNLLVLVCDNGCSSYACGGCIIADGD